MRGTGLNNHRSSFIQIDDNVLLDNAFYMGLYLAVLDRRDLSQVYNGYFDTASLMRVHQRPKKVTYNEFDAVDDYDTARNMSQVIRQYDYNYLIVIVS